MEDITLAAKEKLCCIQLVNYLSVIGCVLECRKKCGRKSRCVKTNIQFLWIKKEMAFM